MYVHLKKNLFIVLICLLTINICMEFGSINVFKIIITDQKLFVLLLLLLLRYIKDYMYCTFLKWTENLRRKFLILSLLSIPSIDNVIICNKIICLFYLQIDFSSYNMILHRNLWEVIPMLHYQKVMICIQYIISPLLTMI